MDEEVLELVPELELEIVLVVVVERELEDVKVHSHKLTVTVDSLHAVDEVADRSMSLNLGGILEL